ncbi:MAG: 16S rRNA (cytosine(1402)-N(4))-methyltransferase RsmH [Clostridia bacterium]|nr:16S rRNA (cytosine(1402)-N(4))-methyltransferase RsmH [Clostridia bacterium]
MDEIQHKRRVRYKGTHPKRFEEKYKELNPEKYADDVQKILDKGHTPAGMHVSIMVKEILDFLDIQPGQVGLDATLGYGGHTRAMLDKLQGQGHIYALDVDPIESAKTKARLQGLGYGEEILTVRLQNFADVDKVVQDTGKKFDFVLADLGVSSMQIDNPERGFTYKADGPLDLRLNPQKGVTGAERLAELGKKEIEMMLRENADEPYAEKIAATIMKWRYMGKPVQTTRNLRDCIAEALSFLPKAEQKEAVKKSCQRTFQAIRIDINGEMDALYAFMEKLPEVLAPNGRVAVLTFHSGEDRLVKKAFQALQRVGAYKDVARDVIRPSAEECIKNSRAKSTKMRWAIRSEEQ